MNKKSAVRFGRRAAAGDGWAYACVAGAFIAGWFITPLVGVGTINQNVFSIPALIVSLLGAIILLAVVRLLSRGGLGARR
ncbi:MAG: GlsB/YeaQ/YmgE family stress response membrane protein [Thermoflexales bacterium]|nr:GlsB/YeaQ/YmgE family stress response membrane protein [Thermoflexales bacterium]